ncbi:bifunctional UDP-N-acetylglucosamine diphosphorylase/glucosamine-1-phosphate N-acetyltransferase GlmU [Sediminicurvatus halobius]|uniref:Bifunctional protein GlmU n=1 Tax=Sediminicurvatus halobius TaxID=2182432 RepID=A0A2U2N2W7_9GAMM|nr:bifunctional UDP-N-acetylglucosamine diphosphorylase/glucosamine-1-phosphate N-acetyltransferase GlmU [Spiribacter halobius]PWG63368.1 UDP-N-acetylglucosamine diphosphorylase/glucosamine-1-phosphate N-acetyltransferase [Spiribacter halobius]UEX78039.1 bifunctional UDP-N-acetylglucosamine diphosphorylase/glucosamine-1-phosphate N-acetyltransferase GlmU [Spiribacter halobius]
MPASPISVIVLAAGEGKRMRSALPKVLHPVGGRPMLQRVLDAARALRPEALHVVYGHGGERVRAALIDDDLEWALQAEQLGTGHAVAQALPTIPERHRVLVLCGDVPLITPATLERLCAAAGDGDAALLTITLDDPTGYGRILRDAGGDVAGIVEEKDASEDERAIREINTGLMCLPAGRLRAWLDSLDANNAQGEYYLTDVIALARREGTAVHPVACPDPWEVQGVNDRAQLAGVERAWQRREAHRLMREEGLGLADPARFDLRGELHVGRDCFLDVGVVVEGEVHLGDNVTVGPYVLLRDCRLEAGVHIAGHSVLDGAVLAAGAAAGPFARLRPGSRLAENAKVGNFVETKNVEVGPGSKINHLSYVGDAELGQGVNVGAGTITCNYDGTAKHRTVIGDGAFIGSNTALVAPVTVGAHATIGAGSTVRRDVPDDALAVTGSRQRTIEGWRRKSDKG